MERICPSCDKKIEYGSYKVFWKASKNNSTCRPCFYLSLKGVPRSENTKQKIGEANSISLIGNVPANKGIVMSSEQKKKLSQVHKGKVVSEKTKQKHRIDRLERLRRDGIPLNEDRGARAFFSNWNTQHSSNFKPKTFWNLGYIADGYDETLHEWIEFDPPHHYYVDGKLKPKDIIRQDNIIQHFKSVGRPLNKFLRVKSTSDGTVLEISNVGGLYGA